MMSVTCRAMALCEAQLLYSTAFVLCQVLCLQLTMRFGSTTNILPMRVVKCYRTSQSSVAMLRDAQSSQCHFRYTH